MEASVIQIVVIGAVVLAVFSAVDRINSEIKSEVILPMKVVLVKGDMGTSRTEDNVNGLIQKVNEVLSQANISFYVKGASNVEMDAEEVIRVIEGEGSLLTEVNGYDKDAVNMFFVKNMSYNGISFPEYKIVVMPDKTTNQEFVAAAHELGHVLGLEHNPSESYLMFNVCNETAMSIPEIFEARKVGKSLFSGFQPIKLSPSKVEFSVRCL